MSNFVLKDGRSGSTAQVDGDNRLQTFASTQTESTFAAFAGDLYNINTETINLTSANTSALLYMSNTDDRDWVLTRIFYNLATSTGGTGDLLAEVIANPTAGTLISAGAAVTPHNLNFGSPKSLTATTLKGAEGSTITDGTVRISTIIPSSGARVLLQFDSIIVPPAASIAIRITPQTSNTSMDLQVGFNLHRVNG